MNHKTKKWEKPNDNSFNWYQVQRSVRCQAIAEVNWESKFENTDKWSPFIHDYVNEFIIWFNMLDDILNYAGDSVRSRYVGVFYRLAR